MRIHEDKEDSYRITYSETYFRSPTKINTFQLESIDPIWPKKKKKV